jgi:hypothetical protein
VGLLGDAMNTFFHFDCWALLSIGDLTYSGDDNKMIPTPHEDLYAELIGLWPTEAGAREASLKIEAQRDKMNRENHEKFWRGLPLSPPSRVFYAFVPVRDVSAKTWSGIESKLEAAAKLQLCGVGDCLLPYLETR